MDWKSIDFDWNRARAFLVTAQEGSFSAAARALGTTQPTVGRQVAALEEELGVTLFERVGNTLQPTSTALELALHVQAMAEAATRLSLTATGQSTSVEGMVSITASEVISAHLLPPVLGRLRREYPAIEIELVASNETRDLQRREADIAVRNYRPTQPELIARKLGTSEGYFYATPEYLDRVGPVRGVVDIRRLEIFGFDHADVMVKAYAGMGFDLERRQFPIVAPAHLVQWELCKRGLGAAVMMSEVGDVEPRVRRAVPGMPPVPVPMWLVVHRELHTSRRIRVVFDMLAEVLSRLG